MRIEDTSKWEIRVKRFRSEGVPPGEWKLETVIGTQRAKHQLKMWKRKYKSEGKDKFKVFMSWKG